MIFNKNDKGPEEIQRVTGTNYRSNTFSVIRPEIISASTTVRILVGKELFSRVETYYKADDRTEGSVDMLLLEAMQSVIAQLAMFRFYQQQLSHEDGGRHVKIDSQSEKMPWAWQIERDDQALLDRYYRALDELYLFLDENDIAEWKSSQVYKDRQLCFIKDLATFQRVIPIEDSYRMFYLLIPFMIEVQERIIRPVIGDDFYTKLGKESDDKVISELKRAVQACIPLFAIIKAVKRMSIKVLPTMIVRRYADAFQGKNAGSLDIAGERRFLDTLSTEATDALTELKRVVTKRKEPSSEDGLIPNNSSKNKYCMT